MYVDLTNAGALMKLSKYLGAAQGVLGGIIWIVLFSLILCGLCWALAV